MVNGGQEVVQGVFSKGYQHKKQVARQFDPEKREKERIASDEWKLQKTGSPEIAD